MGGDGGVIASNRRYMRGAGNADHTADGSTGGSGGGAGPTLDREEAARKMLYCAVSNKRLQCNDDDKNKKRSIVICPYGRLYDKEAAVEALLRRRKHDDEGSDRGQEVDELGAHIRGLKDLHDVRLHTTTNKGNAVPTCPVTGRVLNGQIAAYALIPGTPQQVNVVSEYAAKEMGWESLLAEYGPADEKIHLSPPSTVLEEIKKEVAEKHAMEKTAKKAKRSKKKRKRADALKQDDDDDGSDCGRGRTTAAVVPRTSLSDSARSSVCEAVKSNRVLSSLFTRPDSSDGAQSEKERADRLFAG